MPPSGSGSTGFFSSREMMRLISGIFLIGIVGLLYVQARQSSTWRSIASESQEEAEATMVDPATWTEWVVPHPGHTDPEEIDAIKEEFQAVEDKAPLKGEEMPAQWRLAKWAHAVPTADLQKLARKDILFTHLQQAPDKHRGSLIELKLNIRRVLSHDAPENSANIKKVYEVWGVTEESSVYPYCAVFFDLPPGVPVKADVDFRMRFVGFFFKHLAYDDRMGIKRSSPMLVGRLVYDPQSPSAISDEDRGLTVPWIVGIVLMLTILVLLTQWWGKTSGKLRQRPATHDEATIDSFLDDIETNESSSQNPP